MEPLLVVDEHGLLCPLGGFYIDPWRPAPGSRAVITHAHSDHARWGAAEYLASPPSADLLHLRLPGVSTSSIPFGERRRIGEVTISLHPAGHVLGSAQVRVEHQGEVWVVSGDYKTAPDRAAEAFELVRCDVFITESTFGLPIYRWPEPETVRAELNAWWASNADAGRTSVVYGYSLGKAQRVMAMLDPSIGPVLTHGAIERCLPAYARENIALAPSAHATREGVKAAKGRAMVIAPPSAAGSAWEHGLGDAATAMASGWMRIRGTRRRRTLDRGFVLSDHADWPALLSTIAATGARRVGVTHGSTGPLVRWLNEHGVSAWDLHAKYEGEESPEQASEDAGAA